MKRLAAVVLFVSAVVFAQADPGLGAVRVWSAAQALTEAAPTVVTEGLDLDNVEGFRVFVCAASGQTLSGAGSLQAYYWDNTASLWIRNPSLDLNTTTASVRCLAFPDMQTMVAGGRIFYAATGVTVSSGTLTVYVKAWTKRGSQR